MDKDYAQEFADVFVPSSLKRLMARLIDEVVILILFFPMWGFWYEMMNTEDPAFIPLQLFCFLLFFPMIYEFVFLIFFQQTPGKWLMNLWVVPLHNSQQRLQIVQVFLRSLTGRLSLFFSWAPFALAFFRYDRTHLGDWVAETRVIQKQKRLHLAKIRWLIGFFAILIYTYQGFNQAIYMWDSIDWQSQRVDLQEAMGANSWEDFEDFLPWEQGDDED